MSDFSLYVFHPYGAGKQKSAVTGLPPGPGPLGESPMQRQYLEILRQFICNISLCTGFPVAQMVEHGASNAKIMGSIPRESNS